MVQAEQLCSNSVDWAHVSLSLSVPWVGVQVTDRSDALLISVLYHQHHTQHHQHCFSARNNLLHSSHHSSHRPAWLPRRHVSSPTSLHLFIPSSRTHQQLLGDTLTPFTTQHQHVLHRLTAPHLQQPFDSNTPLRQQALTVPCQS